MKENNMAEPENNMPTATFYPNLAFASEIILPLGTKYNTGPIENPDVAEYKVLIGILGELEKLIFELKERVYKIENAQAAMIERIEKCLEEDNEHE